MVEWSDILIDLNEEFAIVSIQNKRNENIWTLEKSSEDLDAVAFFSINEKATLGVLWTICDKLRIPRAYFATKYNLPEEFPAPEPIDDSEL